MRYRDIADLAGMVLCDCQHSQPYRHSRGWRNGIVIHWSDREIRTGGVYRFLILAYTPPPGTPLWERVWKRNTWAWDFAASKLRMRMPAALADTDRSYLRYLLRDPASRQKGTKAYDAWRWANR